MYQECSMEWQKYLIHLYSVIRLKIQTSLYKKKCCKQQYSKEGIPIFPYDDKQFILLISMGNNNP